MKWFSRFIIATLYCCCLTAFAEDIVHRTKSWNGITMYGSLSEDKCLKYFLETQLRFVDEDIKFESTYLEAAVGRQTLPSMVFWLGFRVEAVTDYQGGIAKGTILWQQVSGELYKSTYIRITDRTRLEEIHVFSEHGVS
ncbi:MAG: DUF2490 domain-containing protein, partial [Pseudomonadota bacterium]|nr:DUF2490 domain-containing protein [Pseudomonadota bacterium]